MATLFYHVCALPDGTVDEWTTTTRYTWVIGTLVPDSFGGTFWAVTRKCHTFDNAAIEYRRRVNMMGHVAGVDVALLPCLIEEVQKS